MRSAALVLIGILMATTLHATERDEGGQSSGGGRRSSGQAHTVGRELVNPKVDMSGFKRMVERASELRERRLISEDEFIRMSQEQGTIVLDARSREKYDLLHVRGAVNLSFPDIAINSLARAFPDKNARILIYCNNNFLGDENAFEGKDASASLNLSTFVALYTYGYRNVYELEPLLDVQTTKIPLGPSSER